MRWRGWREGKLVPDALSPSPTSMSLLASQRGGAVLDGRGSCLPPTPTQSLVEQVLPNAPASNLHTRKITELNLDRLIFKLFFGGGE